MSDIVYNEMVQLPAMPAGDYTLLLWLPARRWEPPAPQHRPSGRGGLLPLGSVTVDDQPRLELYAIWDRYYPGRLLPARGSWRTLRGVREKYKQEAVPTRVSLLIFDTFMLFKKR